MTEQERKKIKYVVERMLEMKDFVYEAIDHAPEGHGIQFEISATYIDQRSKK